MSRIAPHVCVRCQCTATDEIPCASAGCWKTKECCGRVPGTFNDDFWYVQCTQLLRVIYVYSWSLCGSISFLPPSNAAPVPMGLLDSAPAFKWVWLSLPHSRPTPPLLLPSHAPSLPPYPNGPAGVPVAIPFTMRRNANWHWPLCRHSLLSMSFTTPGTGSTFVSQRWSPQGGL